MRNNILIEVKDLKKHFLRIKGLMKRVTGIVKAIDGINFHIKEGECFALVGESGCGKTTTGRCIVKDIEPTDGDIFFKRSSERELVKIADLRKKELKEVRKELALIFQDPYSSLNPRMTTMEIVGEPLVIHKVVANRRELEERVADLLKMVKMNPEYMQRYPHAFSGGQRQRIAIARSLSMQPKFIVADEPISALDVSVQAQILNLLKDLQERLNLTYLFISHNLAVVEYISERVAVMYVGKIVELAETEELFASPRHPYTEALLSAVPKPDPKYEKKRIILRGDVADPANTPSGCCFHPRCRYTREICREKEPPLGDTNGNEDHQHLVACHFSNELTLFGIKKR